MSALIIPTMRYKNAPAAIDFLCTAFGFSKHLVHQEEDGNIVHAQLLFRNSMIMVSSEKDDEFGKLAGAPNSPGAINTMSPYLILEEDIIEEHYKKAIAHGAIIVYDLKTQDYGGKAYSCKDPEGYLWNFGSYNPWN